MYLCFVLVRLVRLVLGFVFANDNWLYPVFVNVLEYLTNALLFEDTYIWPNQWLLIKCPCGLIIT